MSKIRFLEFEYDELVLIPMNLRFGRTSGGNAQVKMKDGTQERSWSWKR